MNLPDDDPAWRRYEQMGIAAVKAELHIQAGIVARGRMQAWLEIAEARERDAAERKQLEFSERNARAAEASVIAAQDSARTSAISARAAIFAAILSFFALLVSIAAYLKS